MVLYGKFKIFISAGRYVLIVILAHLAGFAPPELRYGSAQRQWAMLALLARHIP